MERWQNRVAVVTGASLGKECNVDGHVLIVNSDLGHYVPPSEHMPVFNIYGPSKFALTATTELFGQEFKSYETRIKIISVSPSTTDTEIIPEGVKALVRCILKAEDVARCILFAISTPPHVQVHELSVNPI